MVRVMTLFLLAALLGFTTGNAAPARAAEDGGTLVMLVQPEPPTLASYMNTAGPIHLVAPKIYDGLLEYGFDFQPIPSLAESWSVAPDGKALTFHLRRNVLWHDGQPFTSADVAFTIMEVLKKVHPRGTITFAGVEAVETPDPLTVVIKLKEPSPAVMMALSSMESPMLPKHLLQGTEVRTSTLANRPIGTGPFRFKEWVKGSYITLEKNDHYWRQGLPHLDKIVAQFIPDPGTRAGAMEKQEAQLAAFGSVPLPDVKRLKQLPFLESTTRGYELFSPVVFLQFNLRKAPFNDLRVRQALAHAVDRKFIANNIWYGLGKPATGPFNSNFASNGFYEPDVESYALDLEKAKGLLDEAGLRPEKDGIRFELTHDILPYGEEWRRLGEYLQQAWKKIGVRVTLRYEDTAGFMRRVYTNNDFDVTSIYVNNQADPVLGVQRIYTSPGIQKGVPISNGSGFSVPKIDALFAQAASEPESQKRAALYREIQRLIVAQCPSIWLIEPDFVTFINKKVQDVIVGPLGVNTSFSQVWMAH